MLRWPMGEASKLLKTWSHRSDVNRRVRFTKPLLYQLSYRGIESLQPFDYAGLISVCMQRFMAGVTSWSTASMESIRSGLFELRTSLSCIG